MLEIAAHIQGSAQQCQDRISWVRHGERVVFALADGAGGVSGGDFAAEFVIKGALKYAGKVTQPLPAEEWIELLANLDEQLERQPTGESTLVVVDTDGHRLTGASVGDSMAALIKIGSFADLTRHQEKKPLMGSGVAVPRGFEATMDDSILLMGSDGLAKYTSQQLMAQAAPGFEPQAFIELVRLPSGRLMDDVAVLMARAGKPQKKHPQDGIIQRITPFT